jgi:hypothetical protein
MASPLRHGALARPAGQPRPLPPAGVPVTWALTRWWQSGGVSNHVPDYPVRRPSRWSALALGGGLGSALIHLFIWRLAWRAALGIWRIPTIGPIIDIVLGIVVVALIIVRSQLGPRWWQRRGGRSGGRSGSGPGTGYGSSGGPGGPRDW